MCADQESNLPPFGAQGAPANWETLLRAAPPYCCFYSLALLLKGYLFFLFVDWCCNFEIFSFQVIYSLNNLLCWVTSGVDSNIYVFWSIKNKIPHLPSNQEHISFQKRKFIKDHFLIFYSIISLWNFSSVISRIMSCY